MTNTLIYLLNVPLQNDYQHTFYFSSKTTQESYFIRFTKHTLEEYSYQRKDNIIRVNKHIDQLRDCNYVMYNNPYYSNKWFYAFINKMEYKNDGTTDLYIETDVLQTWMFDYQVKESFVEREHVKDDTIGKHTIPENLQLGDYIVNSSFKDETLKPSDKIVMGCTVKRIAEDGAYESFGEAIGGIYNGIYSGVRYYKFSTTGEGETITSVLQSITNDTKSDAVSSLFLAPEFLLPDTNSDHEVEQTNTHRFYSVAPTIVNTLDGYTPTNKKLLTNPYRYMLVTNGTGGTAEYYHEYFTNNNAEFKVIGSLTPGCSIRLIPLNYKKVAENHMEGLSLGKYPQCNWATDQYINWLTQNGVSWIPQIMGATAAGTMMGGVAGGVMGGLGAVGNAMIENYKASRMPPQTSGNISCGDVITSAGENTFTFYCMSIKKEYAQIIDKFFNMYGYKVNDLKVPNSNHRKTYWYTKLIDANIVGSIPTEDLNKIVKAYNNGITFWKSYSTSAFRDYSVDNSIV